MFGRLYYLENNLNSVLQLIDYVIWIYVVIFNADVMSPCCKDHKKILIGSINQLNYLNKLEIFNFGSLWVTASPRYVTV